MEYKVFVGNVPFDCTQEEFNSAFENIEGFIKADIVTKINSEQSRGFGFVVLDSRDNASKLIERDDIILKDRILRFTEYIATEKRHYHLDTDKTYLLITGLNERCTRDILIETFKSYGDIGKCFIRSDRETGKLLNQAIIEIKNRNLYEYLINIENINLINGDSVEISRYGFLVKSPTNLNLLKKKINKPFKAELSKAFDAGRSMGLIEGLRLASKQN